MITISGYKTFDGWVRADNVMPEVTEEGLVNPEVLTVPCKEHDTFTGLISGTIISRLVSWNSIFNADNFGSHKL